MKKSLRIALGALLGLALRVSAAAPGTLDTPYSPTASGGGAPNFILPLAGGKVIATGPFTNYNAKAHGGVVRLNADGTPDAGFAPPPAILVVDPVIFNGQVLVAGSTNAGLPRGAALRPDGRVVVVGDFTHLGPTKLAAPRIVLLNDNGSPATFAPVIDVMEPATVINAAGNQVYVAGKGNLDGSTRLSVLRLNADGSRDSSFVPPTLTSLGYLSAGVSRLFAGPGDTIYVVVGAAIGFSPNLEVLRLTSSGALDTTFADAGHANFGGTLSAQFAVTPGGALVIFGGSKFRGGTLQNSLTRLRLDGSIDPDFAPPAALGGIGTGAVQADNKVLATGTKLGGIARFNANGSVDSGYVDPAKVPAALVLFLPTQIAVGPDGSSYVAAVSFNASFQQIDGVFHVLGDPNSAPVIAVGPAAQTNTLGARVRFTVTAQGAGPFTYQWFRGATLLQDGPSADLVLATTTAADEGDYRCVVTNGQGSTPTTPVHLTLLAPVAGAVYRETDVPAGPDGSVGDLLHDAAGGLWAAGGFSHWNNTNRVRVVRLLPGTVDLDPAFDSSGFTGAIQSVFDQVRPLPDGRVLAVGNGSTDYGGKSHFQVFRFTAAGAVDTTFDAAGTGGDGIAGTFSSRPTVGADGKVLLFGSAWNGESLGPSHFRLNQDGTRDTGFALRGANYVSLGGASAALTDGRYLVAGRKVAGQPGHGVLRLQANGSIDPTFNTTAPYTVVAVSGIQVLPDGRILVAGGFQVPSGGNLGPVSVGLLRLLADGRPDPEFNAVPRLGSAPGLIVRRIARQADGRILAVASQFPDVFPNTSLIRFWPNGARDPGFVVEANPSLPGVQELTSVAVRPDNTILAGGTFTRFAGLPRTNFVRVIGGALQPTPLAPTVASVTRRVVAKAGGGATFTVAPGGTGPFQFQWRRNAGPGSTVFDDLEGETNATLSLKNLKVEQSGLLQVAVVNPGGAVLSPYVTLLVEPDPAPPGLVDGSFQGGAFQGILTGQYQLATPAPGGMLYATRGSTVVRLHEDGTPDALFQPPADLSAGGIAAVYRQPDGKILVTGRLKDGALARLLEDGSYDPGFVRTNNFTGDFQNVPNVIGVQSDGRILVGGFFENFAGRVVNGLIRFLPDGRVDDTFPLTTVENRQTNPVRTLPGRVAALWVLPDDRFYIGGGFTHVQGATRHGVALLKADGSVDPDFVPPTNASAAAGTAGTMTFYQLGPVTPDGGVYVFGNFRPDAAKPVESALRLGPTGTLDAGFHVQTDFQINTGVVQEDGRLIISGQFSKVNGVTHGNLVRLNTDGSLDTSFINASLAGGVGAQLQLLADRKLLAGSTRYFAGLGPTVVAPTVGYTLTTAGLQITWPAGFKLQRATSLLPPNWQDFPATSPYTAPTTGPGAFFRVVTAP